MPEALNLAMENKSLWSILSCFIIKETVKGTPTYCKEIKASHYLQQKQGSILKYKSTIVHVQTLS